MDWTASGIANSFEFETLNSGLNHTGWLDSVTGGRITESYRGDYRVTASLELDGDMPSIDGYIRIWHIAELGGETVRTILATLVPDEPQMEYISGRWTGSVDLYSGMKRMATSLRVKDIAIAKGRNLSEYWEGLVTGPGSVAYVSPGIDTTKTAAKAYVLEFGETWLHEAHMMADALRAYIEVDAEGRVCLVPYVAPGRRSASWRLESGAQSILMLGVGRDPAEMVNRVIARYEVDGKKYYSTVDLPAEHPWSYSQTGRRETFSLDVDSVASPIQANLDALAAAELESQTSIGARYEVKALFDPQVTVGTVGTVLYADSPTGQLSITGFVAQREIELDPVMQMTLTLEEAME